MRQHLRQCMITFAVLGCTTLMAAAQQHKLDLTQQQKQQISQALASQPSEIFDQRRPGSSGQQAAELHDRASDAEQRHSAGSRDEELSISSNCRTRFC